MPRKRVSDKRRHRELTQSEWVNLLLCSFRSGEHDAIQGYDLALAEYKRQFPSPQHPNHLFPFVNGEERRQRWFDCRQEWDPDATPGGWRDFESPEALVQGGAKPCHASA